VGAWKARWSEALMSLQLMKLVKKRSCEEGQGVGVSGCKGMWLVKTRHCVVSWRTRAARELRMRGLLGGWEGGGQRASWNCSSKLLWLARKEKPCASPVSLQSESSHAH